MTQIPTPESDGSTRANPGWRGELPATGTLPGSGPFTGYGNQPFGSGFEPEGRLGGASGSLNGALASGGEDDDLVERTRRQIRRLTQEVMKLSQASIPAAEFYEGFLARVTQALASQGGAIWLRDEEQGLTLAYQIDLPAALLQAELTQQARHRGMLDRHTVRNEPTLVPPRSGGASIEELENPTPWLLVLAPLRVGDESIGIVEVFLRPGSGPATQRGYLRFLVQMAEYAALFLKNHRLREMQERQQLLERLDRFVSEAHRSLELDPTLFSIVNEGRAVIDVDRVSIAIRRRGGWEVRAVSGLDTVERRSADLKSAARLVAAVCRARETLWYSGDDTQLPPQLENPLHDYLDLSHTKGIGLIPLFVPSDDEQDSVVDEQREPIGCLLIERIAQPRDEYRERSRSAVVARHAERALANALELQSMPLVGPLRAVGRWRRQLGWSNLATGVLVLAAIAAVILGMFVIPYPFMIHSPGQLIPVNRREVFSPTDGKVGELLVGNDPTKLLDQGELLVRLSNDRLLEELNQLEGRERQLEQRITSLRHQKVQNYRLKALSIVEEQQLEADIAASEVDRDSTRRSLELKRDELKLLDIVAPMKGVVIDDQLQQRLQHRPVERGQTLMTMVDPLGPWEVELYLPEKRLWELKAAADQQQKPLQVEFELATLPGQGFHGEVVFIDRYAVVRPGEGNTVLVRVKMDRDRIPDEVRVAGARVEAKVDCGQRSVAFVLFHDFWQMVRSRVLFQLG